MMYDFAEDYEKDGIRAGYVIGAKVKVLRKCEFLELGWNPEWTKEMDSYIGNEYKITAVENTGIVLGYGSWVFPWHVCELITPPLSLEKELPIHKRKNITISDVRKRADDQGSSLSQAKLHLEYERNEKIINDLDMNNNLHFLIKEMFYKLYGV